MIHRISYASSLPIKDKDTIAPNQNLGILAAAIPFLFKVLN